MTLSYLNQLLTEFSAYSKSNPVVAGVVGLWGLGVVTFLLRDIPRKVLNFLERQLTTTLVLNSQDKAFFSVLNWATKNHLHSFVRNFNINNSRDGDGKEAKLALGYGRIFFIHKRRLFSLIREEKEANQTEKVKEKIVLTVFGRDQSVFKELINEIKEADKKNQDKVEIKSFEHGGWYDQTVLAKRPEQSVVISQENKGKIFKHLDRFNAERDWYINHGIPYRTGILLYGPPGTGKTSLIKVIASKYNRPIHPINLGDMSDQKLMEAIGNVEPGGLVVIEDIDAFGIDMNRDLESTDSVPKDEKLTMSGILNAIDGISSAEDYILIVTTNDISKLDSALLRTGRLDLKLELGYMDNDMFREYVKSFYLDFAIPNNFKIAEKVPACDLQKIVFENRDNPSGVIADMVKEGKGSYEGTKTT
jgi:mitochondrial chaperone BCS1